MHDLMKWLTRYLLPTTVTGVASYYICQAIFNVPMFKSAIAISSTIALILAEIISIWWYFGFVRDKHEGYRRAREGLLVSGAATPRQLGSSRPPRSLAQTGRTSAYNASADKSFGLPAVVIGAPVCSVLFVVSNHLHTAPWFNFGGTGFGQAEALLLLANALALLLASYFGPRVALGIGLCCLGANYLDSMNVFYHVALPWPARLGYVDSAFAWPDYVGLIVRCFVAGLVFPRAHAHFRAAGWVTFFVIVLVNAALVYLQMRTYGLSQGEVVHSLFNLTLARLVDLLLVLVAHLIVN